MSSGGLRTTTSSTPSCLRTAVEAGMSVTTVPAHVWCLSGGSLAGYVKRGDHHTSNRPGVVRSRMCVRVTWHVMALDTDRIVSAVAGLHFLVGDKGGNKGQVSPASLVVCCAASHVDMTALFP